MAARPASARKAVVAHREQVRKAERHARPSAASRGYDADWQRLRKAFLAAHPLCQCEHCRGGEKQVRIATVVDHIVPIQERPDLRLDWGNLRAMAKACHDRHTALTQAFAGDSVMRHPEWLRPSLVPLTIVCGPPGAGKTTYCHRHAGLDDLIIDLDQIAKQLASDMRATAWDRRRWLKPALRVRNQYLGMLSSQGLKWPRAWFIVQAPEATRRQWWHDKLHPVRIVVLETPVDECWSRINADPLRASRADVQRFAVSRWWERYTRRAGDQVITWKARDR
jgi:5-methylcytosine-specific restriction endonuclease McrA